jgi:hypothetical protein
MNEKKESESPECVSGYDQGLAPREEPGEGEERAEVQEAEAK